MGGLVWIFHKEKEPKTVQVSRLKKYKADGWRESPAPFLTPEQLGFDPEDQAKGQYAADMVQGVVDSMNGALNLDRMKKYELLDYAFDHYGKQLDDRRTKSDLKNEIRTFIHGNTIQ